MKDQPIPYLVVGSGPAGVACAKALLDQGVRVTLMDIGKTCEPDRLAAIGKLSETEPDQWPPEIVENISQIFSKNPGSLPKKLSYGSDFPYLRRQNKDQLKQLGTQCVESWALGGLSNVWGAAVMPPRTEDIQGWPIASSDLAPHLDAVSEMLKIAAEPDQLKTLFPLYGPIHPPMQLSQQAQAVFKRMSRNQDLLSTRGIIFGRARLAVRASECRLCGLCLSGCPYGLIYNSAQTLKELAEDPRFTYRSGQEVLDIEERPNQEVSVRFRDLQSSQVEDYRARRVFIAAGVIPSLRIVTRSLRSSDLQTTMRYHPYFLMPAFLLDRTAHVISEKLHTLSQLFLEIQSPTVSEKLVHLQFYSYSRLFLSRLQKGFSWLGPLGRWIANRVIGRMSVIQGYLHSDLGEPIQIHARWSETTDQVDIVLQGKTGKRSRAITKKIQRLLTRSVAATGIIPIPGVLWCGLPGDGNHIGATFPMSRDPRALQSDILGRIHVEKDGQIRMAWSNIHLVDASVLPNLPPSTLTFTAMSNAHRIATNAVQLDRKISI